MKAVVIIIDSLFDDEPKRVALYADSKDILYRVCDAINKNLICTNLYISDDKKSES